MPRERGDPPAAASAQWDSKAGFTSGDVPPTSPEVPRTPLTHDPAGGHYQLTQRTIYGHKSNVSLH